MITQSSFYLFTGSGGMHFNFYAVICIYFTQFLLFSLQVNPKGRSFAAGLRAGDGLLMIGNADVTRASHEQAKQEMLRAGNEIDLTVKR